MALLNDGGGGLAKASARVACVESGISEPAPCFPDAIVSSSTRREHGALPGLMMKQGLTSSKTSAHQRAREGARAGAREGAHEGAHEGAREGAREQRARKASKVHANAPP